MQSLRNMSGVDFRHLNFNLTVPLSPFFVPIKRNPWVSCLKCGSPQTGMTEYVCVCVCEWLHAARLYIYIHTRVHFRAFPSSFYASRSFGAGGSSCNMKQKKIMLNINKILVNIVQGDLYFFMCYINISMAILYSFNTLDPFFLFFCQVADRPMKPKTGHVHSALKHQFIHLSIYTSVYLSVYPSISNYL